MTVRAKRAAKYLTEHGWQVYDTKRECMECGETSFDETDNYCSECGSKLPKLKKNKAALVELEDAIAYALQE